MTSVTPTTPAANAAANSAPLKKSNLDYESFLKLLVAQMKNQDPTKPMESTEYVAQLATFSNVEQAINANKKLDNLVMETRISQGIGLIGKQVISLDGLGAGSVATVRFDQEGIIATLSDGTALRIDGRVTIGS